MENISKVADRAATKPRNATDGNVLDRNVNIEPIVPELASPIKESRTESKLLGAVLLFPKAGKDEKGKPKDLRYWVSFDHLYNKHKDGLFDKFFDNTRKTFVGMCKIGVKAGQPYLTAA